MLPFPWKILAIWWKQCAEGGCIFRAYFVCILTPFFSVFRRTRKPLFHSPMLCFSTFLLPLLQTVKMKAPSFWFYPTQNSNLVLYYIAFLHCFRNLKREWLASDLSDSQSCFWFAWAMVIPNRSRKKMESVLDISDSCEAKLCDLLPVLVYKTFVVPDVFTWTLSFNVTIVFR